MIAMMRMIITHHLRSIALMWESERYSQYHSLTATHGPKT